MYGDHWFTSSGRTFRVRKKSLHLLQGRIQLDFRERDNVVGVSSDRGRPDVSRFG